MPRIPCTAFMPALLFGTALVCFAQTGQAWAGSITVPNETAVTAYQGNAPTAYFQGPNPYVAQAPVGQEFETSTLTVQTSAVGGMVVVNFSYLTQFSGSEMLSGELVSNADIFLSNGSGYGPQDFAYAISLGDQAQNGGVSAGFYSVANLLTSQDIWTSRPQFIFGGAYGSSASLQPGQIGYTATSAPTVLTAGQRLSGALVTEQALGAGWYQLNAEITMSDAEAAYFANGMDVFWGTGDCANGSFLADLSGLPMPEPCSMALLASGLFYVLMRRRHVQGARPVPAKANAGINAPASTASSCQQAHRILETASE